MNNTPLRYWSRYTLADAGFTIEIYGNKIYQCKATGRICINGGLIDGREGWNSPYKPYINSDRKFLVKKNGISKLLHLAVLSDFKTTKIKEPKMKEHVKSIVEKLQPYQNYILAAAGLYLLDYLLNDGKGSEKLRELARKLSNKLADLVDKGINLL